IFDSKLPFILHVNVVLDCQMLWSIYAEHDRILTLKRLKVINNYSLYIRILLNLTVGTKKNILVEIENLVFETRRTIESELLEFEVCVQGCDNHLDDVLHRGQTCLNRADLIRVHDGTDSGAPTIAVLCNQGTEVEVLSTGSDLYVEFVANSEWPGQGFKAMFQFQPLDDAPHP
ncbi:unnamed protein product, partial [Heterotrigona itama]